MPGGVLSAPAFWSAFGGPASRHRRGRSSVDWEGADHADGTPAACFVAGTAEDRRSTRGSPAAPLCAARRGAGSSYLHNSVPGTPPGRSACEVGGCFGRGCCLRARIPIRTRVRDRIGIRIRKRPRIWRRTRTRMRTRTPTRKRPRTRPSGRLRNREVGRARHSIPGFEDICPSDDSGDTCATPVWVVEEGDCSLPMGSTGWGRLGVQQPPGHGADVIEKTERGFGARSVDRTCSQEETQVGVNFLG